MQHGLDMEKAEAAMRRAAEKATHGTRDERSGRFDICDDDSKQGETQRSHFQTKNASR